MRDDEGPLAFTPETDEDRQLEAVAAAINRETPGRLPWEELTEGTRMLCRVQAHAALQEARPLLERRIRQEIGRQLAKGQGTIDQVAEFQASLAYQAGLQDGRTAAADWHVAEAEKASLAADDPAVMAHCRYANAILALPIVGPGIKGAAAERPKRRASQEP